MMKSVDINVPIFYVPFLNHLDIKNSLLEYIDNDPLVSIIDNDEYYSDNITKTDYDNGCDFSREWVKEYIELFGDITQELLGLYGFSQGQIDRFWYQQYSTGGTHGWHTHLCNFTGVYYLELPEDSPPTEFLTPFTWEAFKIDAKEGDVVIFPGSLIHKAPEIKNNSRKTILSWNINATRILPDIIAGK